MCNQSTTYTPCDDRLLTMEMAAAGTAATLLAKESYVFEKEINVLDIWMEIIKGRRIGGEDTITARVEEHRTYPGLIMAGRHCKAWLSSSTAFYPFLFAC